MHNTCEHPRLLITPCPLDEILYQTLLYANLWAWLSSVRNDQIDVDDRSFCLEADFISAAANKPENS